MKRYWLLILCSIVLFTESCKKWEDHVSIPQGQLTESIMEHLKLDPQLSNFVSFVQQTGLDSLLSASKNITVFAPTNDAFTALPNSIKTDASQLKAYLQNHISVNAYFTRDAVDSFRIPMLNGKNVFFINNKFDEANIIENDIYLKNGVLHKIDKVIAPKQSIWEFILANKDTYQQNEYISRQNYLGQDPTLAEIDSINPATGEPVYKPGTGIVTINTYKTKILDISNEDSLFTYILLANPAYGLEKNRVAPYFASNSADTADNNAAWTVVKDLTIRGLYNSENLPSVLTSKFGVQIPINKASIIETHQMSNGIVYVLSEASPQLSQKFPSIFVEGENPYSININSAGRYYFRERMDSVTMRPFKDFYMNMGTGGANRHVEYTTNELVASRYKVYLMAFNDLVQSGVGDGAYGTGLPLTQIIRVFNIQGNDSLRFETTATVDPRMYEEIYLGEFSIPTYNWLLSYPTSTPDGVSYLINPGTKRIRVVAPPAAVNGAPLNLTMNYLRFEPFF